MSDLRLTHYSTHCVRRHQNFPKAIGTELFDARFLMEKYRNIVDWRRSASDSGALFKNS
ncbi:MAG: hypothetical protein QOH63_2015 [Acidobacteriota bacterium]|jgi:hypothetical protein|nr:hypothetical protein [Acidobacteriota bacterium]